MTAGPFTGVGKACGLLNRVRAILVLSWDFQSRLL